MVTQSGAATGSASGELTKASLKSLDASGAQPIEFMFNPTEYSMSKSNSWEPVKIVGSNVPRLEFTSGGSTSLSLDLLFDTFEAGTDVRAHTDKIFELTRIAPDTVDSATGTGRPPRVLFSWGRVFNFPAVITNISIQFTLFLSDGTPVRARVSIGLEECEDADSRPAQNPTTQGQIGHKAYVVKPGDTIDRIAYQEFGKSNSWRHLADTNDLDDPKNLIPGQVLQIVPL
jgi:LysM repeat protein